jgi:hypothetical protein
MDLAALLETIVFHVLDDCFGGKVLELWRFNIKYDILAPAYFGLDGEEAYIYDYTKTWINLGLRYDLA